MAESEITCHHLKYYDISRNVDAIFSLFCSQRNKAVDSMKNSPEEFFKKLWTNESLIGIDKRCMYQMGLPFLRKPEEKIKDRNGYNLLVNRAFCCSGCNVMRRLYDTEKKGPGIDFSVECGRYRDKKFIVKGVPVSFLHAESKKCPSRYLDLVLREEYNMEKCEPGIGSLKNTGFVGTDQFTNEILTTWYADNILSSKSMHHINRIYSAFVCDKMGYLMTESPNISDIGSFSRCEPFSGTKSYQKNKGSSIVMKSSTIVTIIKQLLSALMVLRDHDFTIGGVDSDSLVFYLERSIYSLEYSNIVISVNSDFTVKLNNLKNSGITVLNSGAKPLRLYHQSDISDSFIDSIPFNPMIKSVAVSGDGGERYIYKIGRKGDKKDSLIFHYMQNLGIPLYQSSFDIYSFFVLLMGNDPFYKGVSEDPILYDLWKSMWMPEELHGVETDIKKFHSVERMNKGDIMSVLSDRSLRCDVNRMLWKKLADKKL